MATVQDKRLLLDRAQKDLIHGAHQRLSLPQRRLGQLAAAMDALSPLKVLHRGFAVVTDEDSRIIKAACEVQPGASVTVTLSQGTLDCRVERINLQEEDHG